MRRRLLGIDPGTSIAGYACVESEPLAPAPRLVEAGVLRLAARRSLPHRLRQLEEDLEAVIHQTRPSVIAVERIFTHLKSVRTAIVMAHARGVVLLVAERHGLQLIELAPASVKKAVTGRGSSSKRQVQLAVTVQCGLPRPPAPTDVSDAIAIALAAARRLRA